MKPEMPEQFRLTPELAQRKGINPRMATTSHAGRNGVFFVPHVREVLRVIISDGAEAIEMKLPRWEHVSVSLSNRCPTWAEMCAIKSMFFLPEDVVMQLHPAESEYVNNHPFCLHLWRPIDAQIPLPPSEFVGVKGVTLNP